MPSLRDPLYDIVSFYLLWTTKDHATDSQKTEQNSCLYFETTCVHDISVKHIPLSCGKYVDPQPV